MHMRANRQPDGIGEGRAPCAVRHKIMRTQPSSTRSINGLGKQFRYEQQFGNGWKGAAKNVKAKTCENRKIGGENNDISQTQLS